MDEVRSDAHRVVTGPALSYRQRVHQLALLAEETLPYPSISPDAVAALESGLVSDLHEGHAPYRPRYLLPDYPKAMAQGSEYLEMAPPADFDEALTFLQVLYHNVPSITTYPVYLGDLDGLLLPFADGVSDRELHRKLTNFWRFLDRTIPDAFTHANIGPSDNRVARAILAVDRELAQVVPNLTLKWDPAVSGESLLLAAAESIAQVNKPHIANHPMMAADFPGGYGVVSCYNTLPVGGGSHTLVRLNLKESALRHSGDLDAYLTETLPAHLAVTFEIIAARVRFLVEEAGFFDHDFLAREGLVSKDRFTAMFGIYGVAEMAEHLSGGERYGHDDDANRIAGTVIEAIAAAVAEHPVPHCMGGRAVLHAQSGISEDIDVTAGARIKIGTEPEVVDHVVAVSPHHHLFAGGISDIFALDPTVRSNPQAIVDVTRGAFERGLREITFNIAGCDLVRVTGYMVRLSDIEKWRNEGSRLNSTVLGAESVENWRLLDRTPRVISHEYRPRS